MEGPTPVSALIHADTMLTAGVFMIARCFPLFEYPPTALIVITFAGATTSFLAATTGILQNDLKRDVFALKVSYTGEKMVHPISPVKLVEVCRVEPEPLSPDSANTKSFDQSLPLTLFDLLWLRFAPAERLYFYSTSSTDSVVPKLKASLSLALQHFPLLAGNLIWPENSDKPVLTYVQGDAVLVTVAESDADFDKLSSRDEFIVAKEYNPLVPQLEVSHDRAAVMAVQITVFPGRGFSLATSTHHAILDGKSSTSFVKAWAHICKHNGEEPPPASLLPFFDRMVVKDPAHLSELYSKQLQNMDGRTNNRSLCIPPPHKPPQPDMIRGCFEFTRARIQTLRKHVKEMASCSDSTQLHLSTFSLACAYTWVCLAKTAEIKKDKSVFIFGVDCRTRLEPPIPANYFGNCIVGRIAVAETKGLVGEHGLVVAVNAITEAIKTLDEGVLNGAENWVSKFLDFSLYDRIFSIGGSPRFEVYGIDFGWGRAKRVEMMSIDNSGAASLSDSKNGGGGVEVGLVLKKEHMEAFASLFSDQLRQPSTN